MFPMERIASVSLSHLISADYPSSEHTGFLGRFSEFDRRHEELDFDSSFFPGAFLPIL